MVLEAIIPTPFARKHPVTILFHSLVLATIAIWLSYAIFPESASVLAIALTTFSMIPIMNAVLAKEEEEEEEAPGSAGTFLQRHSDMISIYGWFFIGLVLSFSFWYLVLPSQAPLYCSNGSRPMECLIPVKESVFREQDRSIDSIQQLRNSLSGNATIEGKNTQFWSLVSLIFGNNATVLGIALLLSFIYGVGSLFLISWNASIIGVVVGKDAIQMLHGIAPTPLNAAIAYATGLVGVVGLAPHGIPEIIAYFIGAIIGGIISAAMNQRKSLHNFEVIAKDVLFLIVLAYALLMVGAVIEAFFIVNA